MEMYIQINSQESLQKVRLRFLREMRRLRREGGIKYEAVICANDGIKKIKSRPLKDRHGN